MAMIQKYQNNIEYTPQNLVTWIRTCERYKGHPLLRKTTINPRSIHGICDNVIPTIEFRRLDDREIEIFGQDHKVWVPLVCRYGKHKTESIQIKTVDTHTIKVRMGRC